MPVTTQRKAIAAAWTMDWHCENAGNVRDIDRITYSYTILKQLVKY